MKVVLYCRVSSDSQDVDLSISAQLRALRDFAARQGHEIVHEYIDEAESGRTADRPEFKNMIALSRSIPPAYEAVLVWKLNRFSRSRLDSITYKTLLKNKGIKVISISEQLDDSPSGQMLEGVIEVIDEYYSANLGQDIKRGMRENTQRGFYNGSHPPFGLHKTPVQDGPKTRYRLEPDAEGSPSIRAICRIFELAFTDIGSKEIAKTLNREGIRTSTGQFWGKTTVYKILTNEAYCGTLVWGGHRGKLSDTVRIENAIPAIVSREAFIELQNRMSAKKPSVIHPRTVPSFYLLSGFLFCTCGHAMIGRSAKSHQYYYYMCNEGNKKGSDACGARALAKDRFEKAVIDQVKSRILNNDWLEDLVKLVNEDLDSSHGNLKEQLDHIDVELKEIKNRLSKLYDALETGKVSLDDLAPRIRELRQQQEELSKKRLEVEIEGIAQRVTHVDATKIKAFAEELKTLLDEADVAESKAFLRSFIRRIEVGKEKATIYYNLPIPVSGGKEEISVLPMVTFGGAEGDRTPDPCDANAMLSQLSYSPVQATIITYPAPHINRDY